MVKYKIIFKDGTVFDITDRERVEEFKLSWPTLVKKVIKYIDKQRIVWYNKRRGSGRGL